MLVSPDSSIVTSGINATSLTPVIKSAQTIKMPLISAPKVFQIILSSEAKVKSMKLQGYTASVIAMKLGLDMKTVNQYLGIAIAATPTTYKSTYVPSKLKSTYVPPKLISTSVAFKSTNVPPKLLSASVALKSTYVLPKLLSTNVAPKSTYVAPKETYTEPTAVTQSRMELTDSLTQLPFIEFTSSKVVNTDIKKSTT